MIHINSSANLPIFDIMQTQDFMLEKQTQDSLKSDNLKEPAQENVSENPIVVEDIVLKEPKKKKKPKNVDKCPLLEYLTEEKKEIVKKNFKILGRNK